MHQSSKIYQGKCSCGETYVGETKRNVKIRFVEHSHPSGKSEPARHVNNNPDHQFTWSLICSAPLHNRTRKNLEASIIALLKPKLNEQVE